MRIYLPSTMSGLRRLWEERSTGPADVPAHAVTPALRESSPHSDDEELEYLALLDAAGASLALLDGDSDAPRRRVVLAAEVTDSDVTPMSEAEVRLAAAVPLAAVVAVYTGEATADGEELLWWATQEIPGLLEDV